MNEGILLAAVVENVSTRRDGTIKLTLGSQEVSQGKAGELFTMQNKLVALYMSLKDTIPSKIMDMVDQSNINDIPGDKTPSKRMRNVLYLLWKQDNEGYKDFPLYYASKMERYIDELKANIKD